jgi:sugar-specific transcriptional regulator TrmB
MLIFKKCRTIEASMLEKYLEEIGLSDKEAALYLALLGFESATPSELSEKTGIKRTTVYVVLETLQKKGLVSEVPKGKISSFQAEPPERLETYVEQQRLRLEETAAKLVDLIPVIKGLQREGGEKPIVKFYDGKDGILSMVEDFYIGTEEGGVALLIYPRALLDQTFPERQKYKDIRLKKHIHNKVIYTDPRGDAPEGRMTERVRVDAEKYPFLCDIAIYRDRVRFSILGDPLSGISIRSKDVARTLQSLFQLAFENLKKND